MPRARSARDRRSLLYCRGVMIGDTPRLDVPQVPPPADLTDPPADAIQTPPTGPRSEALLAKTLKAGSGTERPTEYDLFTVHYTAWTADGATIDDSRSRGAPAVWAWLDMMVGLRIGVATMAAGEQRRLWIPQAMAHQWAQGPLVFDIELVHFAPSGAPTADDFNAPPADAERSASGIAWRVLRKGSGAVHPRPLSTVTLHYRGWSKDRLMFDDSVRRGEPMTVALDTLIPGLSEAVQNMVEGERSRFWIPAELAYQAPRPPRLSVIFDVELLNIQTAVSGIPGLVEIRTNSPDANYVIVQPDGVPIPGRGSRSFSNLPPGRYRVTADTMRSYALGILAAPADMMLEPGKRIDVTITYRPIVR